MGNLRDNGLCSKYTKQAKCPLKYLFQLAMNQLSLNRSTNCSRSNISPAVVQASTGNQSDH